MEFSKEQAEILHYIARSKKKEFAMPSRSFSSIEKKFGRKTEQIIQQLFHEGSIFESSPGKIVLLQDPGRISVKKLRNVS